LLEFFEYTKNVKDIEKIFLLPMIKISFTEKEEFTNVLKSILGKINLQEYNMDDIYICIVENCLE